VYRRGGNHVLQVRETCTTDKRKSTLLTRLVDAHLLPDVASQNYGEREFIVAARMESARICMLLGATVGESK
jgi:hypothetical protein